MQNGIAASEDNLFWASSESWWWTRKPGVLQSTGSQRVRHDWTTELNWTILSPCNLVVMLLGIYPDELKTYVHTKICTQMFTAALLMTAQTWKQARSPSVDEWINGSISRQWNISHSALRRNELSNHEETWRKLKGRWLNQRNPLEKVTYCTVPTIGHSEKAKLWAQ